MKLTLDSPETAKGDSGPPVTASTATKHPLSLKGSHPPGWERAPATRRKGPVPLDGKGAGVGCPLNESPPLPWGEGAGGGLLRLSRKEAKYLAVNPLCLTNPYAWRA